MTVIVAVSEAVVTMMIMVPGARGHRQCDCRQPQGAFCSGKNVPFHDVVVAVTRVCTFVTMYLNKVEEIKS